MTNRGIGFACRRRMALGLQLEIGYFSMITRIIDLPTLARLKILGLREGMAASGVDPSISVMGAGTFNC